MTELNFEVSAEDLVRTTLYMAGHKSVTEREVNKCRWPDRVAAEVAEGFFAPDAPFARLQRQHLRNKWAALRGHNSVKMALLMAPADLVTAEEHSIAVAWNAEVGGEAFQVMYRSAQDDLAEFRARGVDDPVSTRQRPRSSAQGDEPSTRPAK